MPKATYKPKATDGDGDGLIQDGTEYERPVEVVEEELFVGAVVPRPGTVLDGDTYPALAERYPKPGLTKHQRALELLEINGGRNLRAGSTINL